MESKMAAFKLLCVFVFAHSCISAYGKDVNSNDQECGRIPDQYPSDRLPWHALIYRKTSIDYQYLCSGTLVKPNVVISVAHCFTDINGSVNKASDYAVAVGKSQRAWDNLKDIAQKSDVSKIAVPPSYKGLLTYYQSDIAVVTLATPVRYSAQIQPACLSEECDDKMSQTGIVGKLSAFDGQRGQTLSVLDLPHVPYQECYETDDLDFRMYLTADKTCASFDGTVCPVGNSGAGLVLPKVDQGVTRYYLNSVLSVGHRNASSCPRFATTVAFTKTSFYKEFFKTEIST